MVGRENRSKPKASSETVPNIKITQTRRLGLVSLLRGSLELLDANVGLLLNMSSCLRVKVEEMPLLCLLTPLWSIKSLLSSLAKVADAGRSFEDNGFACTKSSIVTGASVFG